MYPVIAEPSPEETGLHVIAAEFPVGVYRITEGTVSALVLLLTFIAETLHVKAVPGQLVAVPLVVAVVAFAVYPVPPLINVSVAGTPDAAVATLNVAPVPPPPVTLTISPTL